MIERLFSSMAAIHHCVVEVNMMSGVWGRSPRVTFEGSPHHQVEDIILRGPPIGPLQEMYVAIDCEDYPVAQHFPYCMSMAHHLQRWSMPVAKLGRVILTRLAPGGEISWHRDEGPVPEFFTRFHCCLQGGPGNLFTVGDQVKAIRTGEVWEIDVRNEHGVVNMEDHDRIHLIVDVER